MSDNKFNEGQRNASKTSEVLGAPKPTPTEIPQHDDMTDTDATDVMDNSEEQPLEGSQLTAAQATIEEDLDTRRIHGH